VKSKLPSILPCPFDNGKGSLNEIENYEVGFGFSFWCVRCSKCGALGPEASGPVGEREREAVELWNKRA
jgi:hypothetical protein